MSKFSFSAVVKYSHLLSLLLELNQIKKRRRIIIIFYFFIVYYLYYLQCSFLQFFFVRLSGLLVFAVIPSFVCLSLSLFGWFGQLKHINDDEKPVLSALFLIPVFFSSCRFLLFYFYSCCFLLFFFMIPSCCTSCLLHPFIFSFVKKIHMFICEYVDMHWIERKDSITRSDVEKSIRNKRIDGCKHQQHQF